MRKSATARPAARKAQREPRVKKTVAVSRESEPIIQVVQRRVPLRQTPELQKKHGELPVPIATFFF
jgi:hypothetical protein